MSLDKVYCHPDTSGQQMVLGTIISDSDTLWLVKECHRREGKASSGRPVKRGEVIRLEHVVTQRNLHSHGGKCAPVDKSQQEVTAFGFNGQGDENDDWIVEPVVGDVWLPDEDVRLIHKTTKKALHSHSTRHPLYTDGYQEITAFGGKDDNDLWECTSTDQPAESSLPAKTTQAPTDDPKSTASPLRKRIDEHWFFIVLGIGVVVAGITWAACAAIYASRLDLQKETVESLKARQENLRSELEAAKIKATSLEKQLAISPASVSGEPPGAIVVDFSAVDTVSAPGQSVAAAPYLRQFGIKLVDFKPEQSEALLINNRAIYRGQAVKPTTSQNFLIETNPAGGPISFTMIFDQPLESITLTRPALFASSGSGVTHPAWTVSAVDSKGEVLSSYSEVLTRSMHSVPAHTCTLRAPAFEKITALRFTTDPRLNGKNFSGLLFLIERMVLIRSSE